MHRCSPALAVLLALGCAPSALAVPQDLGLIPSVALVDDAAALVVNPAALGAGMPSSLMLTRQGWNGGETRLLAGFGALGLGYTSETAGPQPYNDFTLGIAVPIASPLLVGFTYHVPAEGRPFSTDLGVLARPANYLSVGAMVRNAFAASGAAGGSGRELQLGAGFRPFGPQLTFSADVPVPDGISSWTRLNPFFGLDWLVVDGVRLRAQVAINGDARVGVALAGPQLGMGALADARGAATYMRLATEREASALAPRGSEWATLDLGEALAVSRTGGILGPTVSVPPTFLVTQAMAAAQADPQIAALLVKVPPLADGWANLEELRDALKRFRSAGKPVWAYLEEADFRGYYVACAADRIFLNPAGSLELAGVASNLQSYKGLLDMLGVKAQFVAIGRYKTAMEPFERKDPSPAQREQAQAMLDDQFQRVVAAIAQARKLDEAKVKALVDQALFDPPAAQGAGLVDELAQRDEVPHRLEQSLGRDMSGVGLLGLRYHGPAWSPPVVAVVNAAGAIASGVNGNDLLQGPTLGAETMVQALRSVREESSIRAAVIRVDSPGGSSMASEVIRREIVRLAEKKPLVVSMGNVAASGGYWLSMVPGVTVMADPGTITGSIGVFVGKFSIDGLLAKWGITSTTLKNGARADMESMDRPFTPEEEEALRANGEFTYGRFINLVATQRNLSEGRVRELASGRVYTGAMAKGLGLVDQLSGLEEAIAEVRRKAGIDHQEVRYALYPSANPLANLLDGSDGQIRVRGTLGLGSELEAMARRTVPWTRPGVWLWSEMGR